jgi:ribose transport system substrate-binding protein
MTEMNWKLRVRAAFLVAVGIATVSFALGCGGSKDSSSPATNSSSDVMATAKQQTGLLYSGDTYQLPKGDAPGAPANKTIWLISYGQASIYALEGTQAFQDAAKRLGWKTKVWDGKFDPNQQLAGVRQAIASHADGIWLWTVDCPTVKAAVQQANSAKIPVVLAQAQQCGSGATAPDVKYMFGYDNGKMSKSTDLVDYKVWNKGFGATVGWWMIPKTNAKAKIIEFVETDIISGVAESQGFEDVVKQCSGCEILEKVEFTGQEFGPPLQAKAQQALLKHPDATVVYGNYDTPVTSGIAAAVRGSGRKLILLGGEGDPPNIALIREGVQSAGSGYDPALDAWCSADVFVFLFNDRQPRGCGMGVTLFDKDHNLPPVGKPFTTSVPYQDTYVKDWGVGG